MENFIHHVAPVAARRFDGFGQHPVAHQVGVFEGQFLQLAIDVVEPQAIGDRGVDFECLGGDAAALVRSHGIERAHVVQPIRELDEDDAHVTRHGQQHFAEVFRLRFLVRAEFDLVELGDAIDQIGGGFAEAVDDFEFGDRGVVHDVMEEGGDQRLRVELPARQNLGHRDRVGDVGLAAFAELPKVGLGAEAIGGFDAGDVFWL